ncbi:DUF6625 family protein [Flavobacterium aestivum]|uniref:DUF6625 family protein n=1 Tax=Flavobacterium aestivum TaxID=3003257 RepID=UPI002286B41C|nr:DUF6625 family protein [Flavobacterium aestivum]
MKKISLINIFIGEFPWFFKLFLKSCETNPTIDFFIFTDAIIDYPLTNNIKIIPFSLDVFNQLATKKLGFDIDVKKGYKLCDFRPAFGVIFSEYLKDYDFWGITDIDVIYGRIREFMTDELLEEYDIVCVRHAYITACCMLYKNNEYVNNLYIKSKDYKMIFASPKNYAFDETNFENSDSFLEIHDIFKRDCQIESIQHIIVKEGDVGNLNAHFDLLLIDGISGKLKWDNGIFSYAGKIEFMLYHLIDYKRNIFANNSLKWGKIPDVFYIDKFDYRKNNSVLTRFIVFYDDNLKPFFWNLGKRIDCFLSYTLFRKKVKTMEAGDYYYHLNKQKTVIGRHDDGTNFINMNGFSNIILYEMTFNKNYFFAKNFELILKTDTNQSIPFKKFDTINSAGHSNTYIKADYPI